MIVDDDETFIYLNKKIVALACGDCSISTAINGWEAMNFIKRSLIGDSQLPDVIFLDLDMPVMNGFEFLHQFNELEFERKDSITIAMLTSSDHRDDFNTAMNLGAKFFLSKPLRESDVKMVIQN